MVLTQVVASELGSPTSSALQQRLRDMAVAEARRGVVQGLLEYQVVALFRLDELVLLDRPGRLAEEFMYAWRERQAAKLMPVRLARFASGVAQRVMQGDCQHLHCVALTGKVNRKRLLAEGDAPKK